MNCEEVARLLPLFLDDKLADYDKTSVKEHLATCADCRLLLADLRQEQELLRSLPQVAPPPTWRADLFNKIALAQARKQKARRYFVPRLGSLAAALLIVLLVSNLLVFPHYLPGSKQAAEPDMKLMSLESFSVGEDTQVTTTQEDYAGQQRTAVAGVNAPLRSQQLRWWLWSSLLAVSIWAAGAGFFYYRYRLMGQ